MPSMASRWTDAPRPCRSISNGFLSPRLTGARRRAGCPARGAGCFIGNPDVSEAVFRLLKSRARRQAGSRRRCASPPMTGGPGRWLRMRRAAPLGSGKREARYGGVVDRRHHPPISRSARRDVFPGIAARDRISRSRAVWAFFLGQSGGRTRLASNANARELARLTISPRSARGGLKLTDIVSGRWRLAASPRSSRCRGEVKTEVFDTRSEDAPAARTMPARLSTTSSAFGADGVPGSPFAGTLGSSARAP